MLTRIEIDGFKTFEQFTLDLGAFTVILGPNSSGKSNLFDAIRLLSRLAGMDLRTAVKGMRGETHELFRRQPDGTPVSRMTFAVEVLLNPLVRDPWGAAVAVRHSRARYEVSIELRQDSRGIERLVVSEENARPIPARDDAWKPGGHMPSLRFGKVHLRRSGRTTPWLETITPVDGKASFQIHHDGHAGRTRPAEAAEATVLSSITSVEFPSLYALREELRSWRFLQLDPGALRKPSPTTAEDKTLEPDGSNLATVLARLQAETRSELRPRGVLADIAADLGSLIPGVVDLCVEEDKQNREFRVDLSMAESPSWFSSRVVSDGTLRILALLTMLHDPNHRGLVTFEEPENGVHPARLKSMIRRLRELVTDPQDKDTDPDDPLVQLLLNSHSPVVLSDLKSGETMFADMAAVLDARRGTASRKTRIRPVLSDDQGSLMFESKYVTRYEVDRYLSTATPEQCQP